MFVDSGVIGLCAVKLVADDVGRRVSRKTADPAERSAAGPRFSNMQNPLRGFCQVKPLRGLTEDPPWIVRGMFFRRMFEMKSGVL
jgi:hypothetical protein